mmetsp:Transcript_34536/g.86823  ORF Transcript_34536/g.86823 Transcript_34536/m.86823 type:complete len:287 (-) Transcript_34536:180-1040(-)
MKMCFTHLSSWFMFTPPRVRRQRHIQHRARGRHMGTASRTVTVTTRSQLGGQGRAASARAPRRATRPLSLLTLSVLLDRAGQPVEAFVHAVAGGGARRLNIPAPLAQRVEAELIGDLGNAQGVREVLLVGKHQQRGIAQLALVEHSVKLVARLPDAVAIVRINDHHEGLAVLEVVPPERPNLVLAANVPHGEGDVLMLDRLDIEANGGDGSHDLAKLELVQDGRLPGGVEAHHDDAKRLARGNAGHHISQRAMTHRHRSLEAAREQLAQPHRVTRQVGGKSGGDLY